MDPRDRIPDRPEGRIVYYGKVSRDATAFTDLLYVTLPEYHEHLEWGPCMWQPRDDVTLPATGDDVLVIFDNRRNPWVVAWWPF